MGMNNELPQWVGKYSGPRDLAARHEEVTERKGEFNAVSFHGVPIAAPADVECHSSGCDTAQRCDTAEELLAFMVDHRGRHGGLHLTITPPANAEDERT